MDPEAQQPEPLETRTSTEPGSDHPVRPYELDIGPCPHCRQPVASLCLICPHCDEPLTRKAPRPRFTLDPSLTPWTAAHLYLIMTGFIVVSYTLIFALAGSWFLVTWGTCVVVVLTGLGLLVELYIKRHIPGRAVVLNALGWMLMAIGILVWIGLAFSVFACVTCVIRSVGQ